MHKETKLTAWPQGQTSKAGPEKKEKKKMTNNKKKSLGKKKNPTCNASASTNEGEEDRHLTVRTRAEKRQKRKTKDASTTWCVHINTARLASNPDTLTQDKK